MSNKTVIYCVPGLGIDHRVFCKLNLPGYEIKFLDYEISFTKEDTIASYAKRLSNKITDENPIIIGMSMGGIMAIEISKLISVQALILISTVKNCEEIPKVLKIIPKISVGNKTTTKLAIDISIALKPYYDNPDAEGLALFESMIKNADVGFVNWGLKEISKWDCKELITCPYLHLHGTNDLIFPIKNIDNAVTIKNGTHFTLFNDGDVISERINSFLKTM